MDKHLIIKQISKYFFNDSEQIYAKSRHKTIKHAQRFAFYILKKYLNLTYEEIAGIFGYNHANIQYHVKTLAFNLQYVRSEQEELDNILTILKLKRYE
tara:strand:- start:241 stop:534 length:294 start_codon:yes stop_codon:yes gene_type:complete